MGLHNNLKFVFQLLKRLGIVLLAFTILRVLFYLFNYSQFGVISFVEWVNVLLGGLRFDLTTLAYYFSLFIVLSALPIGIRSRRWYQLSLKLLFYIITVSCLLLAIGDLEYYQFNNKRITSDMLGMADSFANQLPTFLIDFWYLPIIFTGLIVLIEFLYRKTALQDKQKPTNIAIQLLLTIGTIGCTALAARGGWQTIPITPIVAAKYVDTKYTPLVTNSPYTFLHSFTKRGLMPVNVMSEEEAERVSQFRKYAIPTHPQKKDNIVIIVLESFSREFIGSLNGGKGYTPFLDSLIPHSMILTNAYSNAERSDKAIFSILTGIPSFMDDQFMRSFYQGNCIQGLGHCVKQMGYSTHFFHGGINGEFNIDLFAHQTGIDNYYGRNEFNNEAFFDGNWGIYDEEFLQYTANTLNTTTTPFCATIFTLSSHHPFNIPAKYKGKFPTGNSEVIESIGYTDFALRRFFETAHKQKWFNNTLFIITADHPFGKSLCSDSKYHNHLGQFAIPILFYKPDNSLKGESTQPAQQVDILPSILDYIGYKGKVCGFGSSLFSQNRPKYVFQYLGGRYQIADSSSLLMFDGSKPLGLYNYKQDPALNSDNSQKNVSQKNILEKKLQAIIQTFNNRMINNKLCN